MTINDMLQRCRCWMYL